LILITIEMKRGSEVFEALHAGGASFLRKK
jgi:hypothetical protein